MRRAILIVFLLVSLFCSTGFVGWLGPGARTNTGGGSGNLPTPPASPTILFGNNGVAAFAAASSQADIAINGVGQVTLDLGTTTCTANCNITTTSTVCNAASVPVTLLLPPAAAGLIVHVSSATTSVNACKLMAQGVDLIGTSAVLNMPNAQDDVMLIGLASGQWGIASFTYPVPQNAPANQFITGITNGVISSAQPSCSNISGAAAHCGTNASELSAGTVPVAQLPNPLPATNIPAPTTSTLGGVNSAAAVSHKWVNSIGTNGQISQTQPASTDLSDLPLPITSGGTAHTTPGAATANAIGAAASGNNNDITQLGAFVGPMTLPQGGTNCPTGPVNFASLPASPVAGETCYVKDPPACAVQLGVAVVNGGGSCGNQTWPVTFNGLSNCGNGTQNCWMGGGNAALPAGAGPVPINQLPSQTAAYNANAQKLANVACPSLANDVLAQACAASVTAATATTSMTTPFLQTNAANPATSGLVRGANNSTLAAGRNAGNTADIPTIGTDNNNNVVVGGIGATAITLNNTSTVNQGSMAAGAFVDAPLSNAMWLGSTENCTQTWHDWVVAANNSQLLFNCPLDGKIHHLYYRFYQPSAGATFSYNFAPTQAISTALGGALPAPCTTNGCFDDYDVIVDGVYGTIRMQYDGTFSPLNTTPASSCPAGQTCYYVSSSIGNDANTSTQAKSPATPWASISKVMTILSSLNPGDQVLFKGGDTWTASAQNTAMIFGDIAAHAVSGSVSKPIVIGTYGSGQAIVDANNVNNYCFESINPGFTVQYLTLSNFECKHAKLQAVTFQQFNSTFNSAPMPGITVQQFYIHDSGPGCATSGGACIGTSSSYNNQLDFETTGAHSASGVHFVNNIIKWAGGWNCLQVHYDYGAAMVQGNTVGPGCVHGDIDVKGLGSATAQAIVSNNVASGGVAESLAGGPDYYTENISNPATNILWQSNVGYDVGTVVETCPGGTVSSATSGGTYKFYNNTFYSVVSSTDSHLAYFGNATCDGANVGTLGNYTLDYRNNIFDGGSSLDAGGTLCTNCGGGGTPYTTCTEDYNDIGGSQGWQDYFTCSGHLVQNTHDFLNTNPSYAGASSGNFTLNAQSPVDCPIGGTANGPCAGLTGLTVNNSDMGAF